MPTHHIDQGTGPIIVLLHGFPLDGEMWSPQLREFSTSFRVVAPNLQGSSIDAMADAVASHLESQAISEKIVLGGLSMGGYVALAFARRYPQRLNKLILADTRSEPDDESGRANRDRMIALVREKGSQAIIEQMLPKLLGTTSQQTQLDTIEFLRRIGLRQSATAIESALVALRDRPNATPALGQITVPTLVIVGEEDTLTPIAMSKVLVDNIPGAQLEIIPRAGHLSNLENPVAFNAAMKKFVG